jgi:hypothetical protein
MVRDGHGAPICSKTCNLTYVHTQTAKRPNSSSVVEENGLTTRLAIAKPGGVQSILQRCTDLTPDWKITFDSSI